VDTLRKKLGGIDNPDAKTLAHIADYLVRKSVWGVGGDGWAYDIGYGGLDHTLGIGRNVNLLVLDTGVYSNTGGQASKATPLGAVAKFAMGGKEIPSKDLGMMAMEPDHPRLPRSGVLRRALDHHRLLPLHCPRLQHVRRSGPPEGGG